MQHMTMRKQTHPKPLSLSNWAYVLYLVHPMHIHTDIHSQFRKCTMCFLMLHSGDRIFCFVQFCNVQNSASDKVFCWKIVSLNFLHLDNLVYFLLCVLMVCWLVLFKCLLYHFYCANKYCSSLTLQKCRRSKRYFNYFYLLLYTGAILWISGLFTNDYIESLNDGLTCVS